MQVYRSSHLNHQVAPCHRVAPIYTLHSLCRAQLYVLFCDFAISDQRARDERELTDFDQCEIELPILGSLRTLGTARIRSSRRRLRYDPLIRLSTKTCQNRNKGQWLTSE